MARFGPQLGATKTGASLYELPAGQSICPYHYEYGEEEWLIVLEGRPTLRHPGGEDELEPGDTVCFPEGPEGAHKVTNRTDDRVRVLMFSTVNRPAIAVYPDSDKFGVFSGTDDVRHVRPALRAASTTTTASHGPRCLTQAKRFARLPP